MEHLSADPALSFRRAELADTGAAQLAYRRIIEHLADTATFPHWHTENRPTPGEVQEWVAAGELFLALAPTRGGDGAAGEQIAGVVVLNHRGAEAYQEADWAVAAAGDEVLVIHVLGVVPEFLRRGVARRLVALALDVATDRGCRAVRLDTYVENTAALELYRRSGFTDLGRHTVRYEGTDLTQFHLFERVLPASG